MVDRPEAAEGKGGGVFSGGERGGSTTRTAISAPGKRGSVQGKGGHSGGVGHGGKGFHGLVGQEGGGVHLKRPVGSLWKRGTGLSGGPPADGKATRGVEGSPKASAGWGGRVISWCDAMGRGAPASQK